MSSINKAIVMGRLGRDPEARSTQSGSKIVSLSIATEESWTDKATGEKKSQTEWHRVVIFNEHFASVAERFLKKGDLVHLEGKLQTRKWTDQSGAEKFTTEIVLSRFKGELTLMPNSRGDAAGGDSGRSSAPRGGRTVSDGWENAGASGSRTPDLDDEIPF